MVVSSLLLGSLGVLAFGSMLLTRKKNSVSISSGSGSLDDDVLDKFGIDRQAGVIGDSSPISAEKYSDLGANVKGLYDREYIINGSSSPLSTKTISSHEGVFPLGRKNTFTFRTTTVDEKNYSSSSSDKNTSDDNEEEKNSKNKPGILATLLAGLLTLMGKAVFWIIIAIVGLIAWLCKDDKKKK